MQPSDVSAVIVTRGNTDLTPVLDSLAAFDEVIVWDNSAQDDHGTYGLVPAVRFAKHDVIYSQDDDIVHTPENHRAILSAYTPGVLTGCMWDEWSAGAAAQGIEGGYSDLVFYGSGAVYDRHLPALGADVYLAHYPDDAFFRLWFSCVFGILAPSRQLDVRFEALPEAEADYRMCNLPNGIAEKTEAIMRSRGILTAAVRDLAGVA